MTSSELIVTLLIWVLAGCGGFFSIRGMIKRRKNKKNLTADCADQADKTKA